MRILYILIISFFLFSGCRKDEKFSTDPSAKLSFSLDTVLFDTVFTSIGSTTKRLKIYNLHTNAIRISSIKLAGGASSSFKINVNGESVTEKFNLELFAGDSATIFVKVNINPGSGNLPFIVSDSLLFETNGNLQQVQLNAYGQNAVFIDGKTISEDTVWDKSLPYVIYNSALVDENSTLTIQKGAQIYFHKDSRLYIAGTLIVNGAPDDSVTFSSDRKEQIYKDEPGQWVGLHFLRSSKNNIIQFSCIQNALSGIRVDSLSVNSNPKLILSNSMIKNMEVSGLELYNADFKAFNNLVYNCGQFLVYSVLGGRYDFKQNTFAAYNFTFNRKQPALYFSDTYSAEGISKNAPLTLNLTNNIIWGSLNDELLIDDRTSAGPIIQITTNLIRSTNSAFSINGNILNSDPKFLSPVNSNYQLSDQSPALNKGINLQNDPFYSAYLYRDLKGTARIFPSELGCYELN